jgi:hypothetical protein
MFMFIMLIVHHISVVQRCGLNFQAVFSNRAANIFQILDANSVTRSQYHTEDPQIFGTTVQSLVTLVTWHPRFVRP